MDHIIDSNMNLIFKTQNNSTMKNLFFCVLSIAFLSLLISCDKDDSSPESTLNLNLSGLENLGNDFAYEGWIMVNGSPQTTGTFSVEDQGHLSQSSFELNEEALDQATAFILTIEPNPDPDPAPSDVHILAGDFNGEQASLSIDHGAALATNFSSASGAYVLATPTDGMDNNEKSGLWFLDLSSGSPMTSLNLPVLPAGWTYEGWAVINGTPVTTGTFLSNDGDDDSAPYSGNMSAPPFPGEDFIVNAPTGLNFPTDLSGGMAVISVEPVPDNSPAPFLLKPMVGNIPADAQDHITYSLNGNLNFPSGTATK